MSTTTAPRQAIIRPPTGGQHGFLFNIATGVYTFLDDPSAAATGLSITQITSVNDMGEIDGFYVDATTGLQTGSVGAVMSQYRSVLISLVLNVGYNWRRRSG